MKINALRIVRKAFCHPLAPRTVQRHNCRQWVKSVRMLGDRWVALPQNQQGATQ